MAGLAGACGLDGEVTLAEAAMEEVEGEAVEIEGELGIVAWAFVAEEGMGSVDLVPGVLDVDLVEAGMDLHAAFEGDVGILAAPGHEELSLDVFGALERVVVHTFAE